MTIAPLSPPENLNCWLQAIALRLPEKIALTVGTGAITYAQLEDRSRALARRLLQEGIQPGDRVGIHWANSVECALLMFACFQAGIIALPINIRFKAAEIAYVMQHAGAVAWFSQPELVETARAAAAELVHPLAIRSLLPEPLTEGALPAAVASTLAVIMYTSGTTARPKGVIHTHSSLLACARAMASFGIDESQVVLGTTSMMHGSGMVCTLLGSIHGGATAVLMPAFDPADTLDLIEKNRCTWALALPSMMQLILDEQEQRPRDLRSLRVAISGGDVVPLKLQERFQRLFPEASIRELYGITEIVPVACGTAEANRQGSVGRPASGIAIRVLDATGYEAHEGEIGEFAIQSAGNFAGYWNDDAATKAVVHNGWFLTGDLGHRDRDGFYWFKGRKKEIIIRGGSNISPQEVEDALYRHPAVREAGVIGLPHQIFGEEVVAYVALHDGQTVTEKELSDFARKHLSDYKVPARIIFLSVLPKGITGKVQRRALKDMLCAAVLVQ
ncbi:MAG: class I adenylate-forming enzyme family protein [Steroidobacteraceae bacterium]